MDLIVNEFEDYKFNLFSRFRLNDIKKNSVYECENEWDDKT